MQSKSLFFAFTALIVAVSALPNIVPANAADIIDSFPSVNSPADGIGNGDSAAAASGPFSGAVQQVSGLGNGIGNDNTAIANGNAIHPDGTS